MSKKVIRFTGSPDCDPATWLRINHITEQPGPGSAFRVTIEPIEAAPEEPPVWQANPANNHQWFAGIDLPAWHASSAVQRALCFQNGTAAVGSTREDALANLAKAKARGPL